MDENRPIASHSEGLALADCPEMDCNGEEMAESSTKSKYVIIDGRKCYASTGNPVGRTPGTKNAQPNLKKALTPKAYMTRIMQDENEKPERRDKMAITVAPYYHAKLQATANLNLDVKMDSKEDIEQQLMEHGLDPALVFGSD